MSNTHNEIGLLNANGSVTPYGSTGGGGSGGSGGHIIVNASGTEMPAEDKLQFGNGFSVTDDSTNGKTIVTPNTNVIANQKELSNLVLTGTTNTSGGTIASDTCFVLDGDFVTAKADIASGATFTLNTNYEKKSVGSILTELNSKLQVTPINDIEINSDVISLALGYKYGHICVIIMQYKSGITVSSNTVLLRNIPTSAINFNYHEYINININEEIIAPFIPGGSNVVTHWQLSGGSISVNYTVCFIYLSV